ncbi:hypothetical protein V8E36_002888 [Tilletia maclaganii]
MTAATTYDSSSSHGRAAAAAGGGSSLKSRVVRSLSLRRRPSTKQPQPQQPLPSSSAALPPAAEAAAVTFSPSSPIISASPNPITGMHFFSRPSRASVDQPRHPQPQHNNSNAAASLVTASALSRSFGSSPSSSSLSAHGIRLVGSAQKPSSPLANTAYTSDPFDYLGADRHVLSTSAPIATTKKAPASPRKQPISTAPIAIASTKKEKGRGHGHTHSHTGISLLSRSLSRSKYLGGDNKQLHSGTTASSSYQSGSHSASSTPQHSPSTRPSRITGFSGLQAKFKSSSAQRTPANPRIETHHEQAGDGDGEDEDEDDRASSKPLLRRGRSFDSLVPSVLGDPAPQPRIIITSTKRGQPLERVLVPPPRNVFAMQRIPWGEGDDEEAQARTAEPLRRRNEGVQLRDGGVSQAQGADGANESYGIVEPVDQEKDEPEPELSGFGTAAAAEAEAEADTSAEIRQRRERAQTADARLGLLKPQIAGGIPESSEGRVSLNNLLPASVSGPTRPQPPSAAASPSATTSLLPRSPATSPGLAATRITGTGAGVGGGASPAALREHWTRELEGQRGPFIVVERGWKKGIYTSGEEAAKQIRDFPGPRVRKVETAAEAIAIVAALQPVTPSPTTAEGLLARSGSQRGGKTPYGAAGVRASRFLGLDVAAVEEGLKEREDLGQEAAAAAAAAEGSSGQQQQQPRVVLRGSRAKDVTGAGGMSYAARRAARLAAEAEAEAGAKAQQKATRDDRQKALPMVPLPTTSTDIPAAGAPSRSWDSGSGSVAYGRSSVDALRRMGNPARPNLIDVADIDDTVSELRRNPPIMIRSFSSMATSTSLDLGSTSPFFAPVGAEAGRDRTRSGGGAVTFSPDLRPMRVSGSGSGGGRSHKHSHSHSHSHSNSQWSFSGRPSSSSAMPSSTTARTRQEKAARLEYGLDDDDHQQHRYPTRPRGVSGGGQQQQESGPAGGSREGRKKFGHAYASALGATGVQRAHTISGAR